MYKKGSLRDIPTSVSKIDDIYVVNYSTSEFNGECRYKLMEITGSNKPIKQTPLLMVHCDMKNIIDFLDGEYKLSSEDYNELSMDIRNHSLSKVEEFLNKLS